MTGRTTEHESDGAGNLSRQALPQPVDRAEVNLAELHLPRYSEAEQASVAPSKEEVLQAIRHGEVKFLGRGGWEKDSAYQAYEYKGRCYVIIVVDPMSCWLEDSTLQEIPRKDVEAYVYLK